MSKALGVKSRIDFFLVAKHLTKFVKKVDIQTSIASDHNTICLLLSWPDEHPRGPGFWKFNNTLLDDEEYTSKIRELYPELRKKYSDVKDQQLFWELMKMEIRTVTISFAKGKAQTIKKRETVIKEQLDELDKKYAIAKILIISMIPLNNMMTSKRNSNNTMTIKAKLQFSGLNVDESKKERKLQNISLT